MPRSAHAGWGAPAQTRTMPRQASPIAAPAPPPPIGAMQPTPGATPKPVPANFGAAPMASLNTAIGGGGGGFLGGGGGMLGGGMLGAAPAPAAPQFSDPYEAAKQARLSGNAAPPAPQMQAAIQPQNSGFTGAGWGAPIMQAPQQQPEFSDPYEAMKQARLRGR